MILSKDEHLLTSSIVMDGKTIQNNREMKILGTKWNYQLNWNTHYEKGTDALITNLKRRKTIINNAINKMGSEFAKNMAQAIFFGKLYHHVEIIGNTKKETINKVDSMIISMAKKLGIKSSGKTNEWILKKNRLVQYGENL